MSWNITARSRAEWEDAAAGVKPEGRALIDGKFVDSVNGCSFDDISPIDGKVVATVARCDSADADIAVASARAAFDAGIWRHTDPKHRKLVLRRFSELIRADAERLAILETLDVGKPILNSVNVDVALAADCIAYYAEFADKLFDEIAPTGPNDLALVRREPLGVVAAIVPWNYPLIITAWKVGPALLAGNSVVLKPAEQSPLTAIRVGELALEAGLPPGVLNVLPGFGEEAGKPLALHPDVDMVGFTGSTEVGKLMMRYSGESNLKRVALELGGKSPHVVMADADLAAAAEGIAWGIYYNQGETCHAGSRVIVHESVKDALIAEIARVAHASIPIGHPFDPATQMGAMIDQRQMERVLGYIESGRRDGAELALGGNRVMQDTGGYYIEATILDRVTPDMSVSRDEIFGPVLTVTSFETEAEAMRLANDTIYGLAGAVWTADMNVAHRLSNGIRAGTVWVNTFDKATLATPFGGFKQSGFGRDRSPHAIDKYVDMKTIWTAYR
jgi:acyl-CoA reductase-like NAD-dependent aldehyde dehydrogenase